MRALPVLLAALAMASLASAQDVSRAHLITPPDAQSMSDRFPVVALARAISGRAVLECAVAADGSSQCAAAEETPADMGFGAAATELARGWRFTPRTEGGQAVASAVRVPVVFQNPISAALPIEPALPVDGVRGPVNISDVSTETRGFDPTRPLTADIEVTGWVMPGNIPRRSLPEPPQPTTPPIADVNTRYYPEEARAANIDGRVLVACVMRSDRRLECAAEGESPSGRGFAQKAVSLLTEATDRQALTPGQAFRVPVDFALHDQTATAQQRYVPLRANEAIRIDYGRLYPERAIERRTNGRVILGCVIQPDRHVRCTVRSEAPPGAGFGASALRLAARMEAPEAVIGQPGVAVGDELIVPVAFRIH